MSMTVEQKTLANYLVNESSDANNSDIKALLLSGVEINFEVILDAINRDPTGSACNVPGNIAFCLTEIPDALKWVVLSLANIGWDKNPRLFALFFGKIGEFFCNLNQKKFSGGAKKSV